jgi:hypothetical protein
MSEGKKNDAPLEGSGFTGNRKALIFYWECCQVLSSLASTPHMKRSIQLTHEK